MRGRLTVAGGMVLLAGLVAWSAHAVLSADVSDASGAGAASHLAVRGAVSSPPPPLQARASSLPYSLLRPPVAHRDLERLSVQDGRLAADVAVPPGLDVPGPLHVDYTLDAQLTRQVWKVLRRGRVALGHVILMDPRSGALLVYVSTDPKDFPPTGLYPAASLVKVVTAATALRVAPQIADQPCRYVGSPYRLTARRLDAPRHGREVSLQRALATSNNQCFARYAVHRVGSEALLAALDRFGLLSPVAPGHGAGRVTDPGDDPYALGRLGSGLAGLEITPLHAVQLAATLAAGRRIPPYWIERITDGNGRVLREASPEEGEPVISASLARELREMLVQTTRRGTARRAFRTRRGRPLLQGVSVAGKTGSLSGHDPDGRYEWFIGLAPADHPVVAVATLTVEGARYWMSSTQLAAEVLKRVFCPEGVCSTAAAERVLEPVTELAGGPEADQGS